MILLLIFMIMVHILYHQLQIYKYFGPNDSTINDNESDDGGGFLIMKYHHSYYIAHNFIGLVDLLVIGGETRWWLGTLLTLNNKFRMMVEVISSLVYIENFTSYWWWYLTYYSWWRW